MDGKVVFIQPVGGNQTVSLQKDFYQNVLNVFLKNIYSPIENRDIHDIIAGSQTLDNAGGSKLTVKGYSVTSSAAAAMVVSKSLASDGRVYAIDTVI